MHGACRRRAARAEAIPRNLATSRIACNHVGALRYLQERTLRPSPMCRRRVRKSHVYHHGRSSTGVQGARIPFHLPIVVVLFPSCPTALLAVLTVGLLGGKRAKIDGLVALLTPDLVSGPGLRTVASYSSIPGHPYGHLNHGRPDPSACHLKAVDTRSLAAAGKSPVAREKACAAAIPAGRRELLGHRQPLFEAAVHPLGKSLSSCDMIAVAVAI